MNRSAIIVKNLQASQFSVALSNGANKVLSETSDLDIIIYYESWAKLIINPKFGMLMDREMLGATGICVATDLKTAYKLIKTPGPDKKYFYVWNLEWIGMQKAPFNFLHNIYSFSQEKADFNNGGNLNILFNSLLVQINKKQCKIFAANFGEIIIGRKGI